MGQNHRNVYKDYHKIFSVSTESFEGLALEIFRYQARSNPVYAEFVAALGIDPEKIREITAIPFLPIRFFKTSGLIVEGAHAEKVFESSGTTGMQHSKHLVADLSLYEESFTRCFELFYGPVTNWCVIGLLPSYLERSNSSLVYMTSHLITASGHPDSGFYLDDLDRLMQKLKELEKAGQPVWLIGVSFALLDLAEKFPMKLDHTLILETGGMKGRREELIRPELHDRLMKAFHKKCIHSEYGMTELLSQSYSKGEGVFNSPPWMKILLRDAEDPFHLLEKGRGTINVIDLANIHSCSFIATDDTGSVKEDGSFELWGRVDGSDLRGCSLLIA